MSDRYWDVRSCSWQGGTEEFVPDWCTARARATATAAVPSQTTVEQVEALPSPPARQGTAAG